MLKICEKDNIIKFPAPLDEHFCNALVERHRACGTRELELTNGTYLLVHEHPTSEGGIVGIYTDVTILKKREKELIDSNLISETLSLCGNMLIHARNESFILSEVCRIITEVAKFEATWITTFAATQRLPEYLSIDSHSGLTLKEPRFKPTTLLKQTFVKQEMHFVEKKLHQRSVP